MQMLIPTAGVSTSGSGLLTGVVFQVIGFSR